MSLNNLKPERPTKSFEKEIIELHSKGHNNRTIAEKLDFSLRAVAGRLDTLGLKHNGGSRIKFDVIGSEEAKCSICAEIKNINQFQFVNKTKNYRQSFCNGCRNAKRKIKLRSDFGVFLTKKFSTLKSRCNKTGITFSLSKSYIETQFKNQKTKCFYSDINIDWQSSGIRFDSMSFDKIIPSLGYIEGNVVLTINRVNMVKQDCSLEEIRAWMPFWYNRIIRYFQESGVIYDGENLIFPNGSKHPHKKHELQ